MDHLLMADWKHCASTSLQQHILQYLRVQSHFYRKSMGVLILGLLVSQPVSLLYAQTAKLDWVPREQLTQAQQAKIPTGCCGDYIEPQRTDADAHAQPQQSPLRATADKAEVLQKTTTVMEGSVKLTQGFLQVEADKIVLDQQTEVANIEGNIRLREPGLLLTGERATLNTRSRHATLSEAEFVLHETRVRGGATELKHLENDVLILRNSRYSRCEPNSDAWLLKGSEITIDPNAQQGWGKNLRLNIKGVPIFYTPYLSFPVGNARKSGFLFPFVSSSDNTDNGLNLGIPYYFNIAPNYDLTLTPRHIDGHGQMLEGQLRHLSKQFATAFNVAHLGNDKDVRDDDDERILETSAAAFARGEITAEELHLLEDKIDAFKGEDRWLFNVNQTGGQNKRWATRVDVTKVSDIDYFRDLDTASLSVNSSTHLRRLGNIDYRSDNWLYRAKVEHYQTIVDNLIEPYRQSPRLNADGDYRFGDWVVALKNEYAHFDLRDDSSRKTGQRVRLDYRIGWEKEWLWGYFKPTVMVKHLDYKLRNNLAPPPTSGVDNNPSVSVPQGSLDMGIVFEREGTLFDSEYLQTFEPQLFYFYSDFKDQSELSDLRFDTSELTFNYNQLFRDTRFSGGDRIDDTNQLSVGLTTRFSESSTGTERLRASLGQIYYFSERRVSLSNTPGTPELIRNDSELAVKVTAQIGDHWRFNSDLQYHEQEQEMSRGNMSLRYLDEQYRLFNLGYRYVRQAGTPDTNDIDNDGNLTELIAQDINQADISLLLPIYRNWSAIGRYNKDFTNKRELEKFVGLEYNSCCYRLRVVWRRWLDNSLVNVIDDSLLKFDEGIFFEIQLKGLGGTGSTVNKVLSEGIVGYDRREKNLR